MVDHSYAFETNDRGTWEIRVATLFSVLILLQFATHILQPLKKNKKTDDKTLGFFIDNF